MLQFAHISSMICTMGDNKNTAAIIKLLVIFPDLAFANSPHIKTAGEAKMMAKQKNLYVEAEK
ncbi:hypothetical protein A3848_24325 [Paenibacillus sp. P32E]|nr:hypothetical protein A3848_24325 [Paenibacillus sp. P32E]